MNIFTVQTGFNERGKQKCKSKNPVKTDRSRKHTYKNQNVPFTELALVNTNLMHASTKENDPLIAVRIRI